MLPKTPKSKLKRFLGVTAVSVFVVEAAGLVASYGIWRKLNTERDFRLYMFQNYNWLLEGYYSLGKTVGGLDTREQDKKIWENEGKI